MTSRDECQPSLDQAVLIGLCRPSHDPDAAADVLAALTSPRLDWGRLLEQAITHRMVCLLAGFLHTHAPDLPSRSMMRHLQSAWHTNQHKIDIYRAAAASVAARTGTLRLAAHGGIAEENRLYHGSGVRPLSDIDLLVHPADQQPLAIVLAELGYQHTGNGHFTLATGDLVLPTLHLDTTDPPHAGILAALLDRRTGQPIPGHHPVLPVLNVDDAYRLTLTALPSSDLDRAPAHAPKLIKVADAVRLRAQTSRLHAPTCDPDGPGRTCAAWDLQTLARGQQVLTTILAAQPARTRS